MYFAARYWGVLNRLRDEAVAAYARERPLRRAEVPPLAVRVIVGAVWLFGLAWIIVVVVLALRGSAVVTPASRFASVSTVALTLLMLMPGVAIVWIVTRAMMATSARLVALRAFDERATTHADWHRVLSTLAETWHGSVGDAGVEPACRFLKEHHPECAPRILLQHQDGPDELRLTLVGRLDGCPVLVEVIDVASPSDASFRPPVLVVLVASPMELPVPTARRDDGPFRAPPPAVVLEDTAAHAALSRDGMIVGWTPSGAWAMHRGPADALVNVDRIAATAASVLEFCRSVPSPEFVPTEPIVPTQEGTSSCERTVEAFMSALRDGEALDALARAHPVLVSSAREPTPADLSTAVDAASARARVWRVTATRTLTTTTKPMAAHWQTLGAFSDASIGQAGAVGVSFAIETAAGARVADVHLERGDAGRWSVCGYAVGGKQVLGVAFPESSD